MSLGRITVGNMRDIVNAVKQGKKVCAVYDRESHAYIRNFMSYPSEEEKEVLSLLGGNIGNAEFSEKTYDDALLMYASYDANESLPDCFVENNDDKPYLLLCHQDMLTQPVKYLAWLQASFDEVYLL